MYGYNSLLLDAESLTALGYRQEIVGKTVFGYPIPAFLRGDKPTALIIGATHAREHITAKLVAELAKSYSGDKICFLPMLNIDGIRLIEGGKRAAPEKYQALLTRLCPSNDFSLWKANGRGVDINVNYDADWGGGILNVKMPGSENYIGEYPISEPETAATVSLAHRYRFKSAISYHAKGEVIYWRFKGAGNEEKAQKLGKLTGYTLVSGEGSSGGFKDWFLSSGYGDGYTVEVGNDIFTHPFSYSEFDKIHKQNVGVPALLEEFTVGRR